MATEMVERVRNAILLAYDGSLEGQEPLAMARAAVEAMRLIDPQEGVPGGIAFEDTLFGDADTIFHAMRNAWNATIDAALKE